MFKISNSLGVDVFLSQCLIRREFPPAKYSKLNAHIKKFNLVCRSHGLLTEGYGNLIIGILIAIEIFPAPITAVNSALAAVTMAT